MKSSLLLLFYFISFFSFAQKLTPEFHTNKREKLRKLLPKNSVAVFFSNPFRNRANDVNYLYHQDPNFYYLTGWKEPESILLIFSEPQTDYRGNYTEKIYIRNRNAYDEMWNGKRLGIKGAKKMGFQRVALKESFLENTINFSAFDKILFFDFQNDIRDNKNDPYDLFNLINHFKKRINFNDKTKKIKPIAKNQNEFFGKNEPDLDTENLPKFMQQLREVKTEEEIKILKKAINISAIGQLEVMKAIHPNMSEREIQGIHEFVYKKYGIAHEGYPSIVGAGHNGCVLHYITNDLENINSQLVLMDLGAEYENYTADVTRTIPSTGVFTKEEREIYEIVYNAQEAGIKAAKVGAPYSAIDKAARKIVAEGLIKLGIIADFEENKKYFPHGTSHHIGLDVHDAATYNNLKENSIITVEPGIYIPENSPCNKKWWGIAIRIEDDILITKRGAVLLSDKAPRKWQEIERTMKENSPLNNFKLPELD